MHMHDEDQESSGDTQDNWANSMTKVHIHLS